MSVIDEVLKGLSGCGDNSCLIEKPNGMGTNGGCRCHESRSKARIILSRLRALRQQWRSPEEAKPEREYLIKYGEPHGGESTKLAYMDESGYWEDEQGELHPAGIIAIADPPPWTEEDERKFGGEG